MSRVPLLESDELPTGDSFEAYEDLPPEYSNTRHVSENRFQNSLIARGLGNNMEMLKLHRRTHFVLWSEKYTGLSPRENELIILTMGRANDSKHEWNSHMQNAVNMGWTEDQIRAISRGDFDELEEKDATLARYVTAYAHREVTDELHDELAQYYDDSTIVGIMMLAGYYRLTDVMIDALGNPPAEVGDDLEHLGYEELLAD